VQDLADQDSQVQWCAQARTGGTGQTIDQSEWWAGGGGKLAQSGSDESLWLGEEEEEEEEERRRGRLRRLATELDNRESGTWNALETDLDSFVRLFSDDVRVSEKRAKTKVWLVRSVWKGG
jgi:hypothetical protein